MSWGKRSGLTVKESCGEASPYWYPRSKTNAAETIRRLYNDFKLKPHPLTRNDMYRKWHNTFLIFRGWVLREVLPSLMGGSSGQDFAKSNSRRLICGAMTSLGKNGFVAMLRSVGLPEAEESAVARWFDEFSVLGTSVRLTSEARKA